MLRSRWRNPDLALGDDCDSTAGTSAGAIIAACL
jgi:hypothetical protein